VIVAQADEMNAAIRAHRHAGVKPGGHFQRQSAAIASM
jgi:hypothetical protein